MAIASVRNLSDRRRTKKNTAALPFTPEHIWTDKEVADHPQTIRILNKLAGIEMDVVDDARRLKRPADLATAKRQLVLARNRSRAFKPCQGMGRGHLCCNYHVIDLISGCPMDCSYCVLQSYLANNPVVTAYVNLEEILINISSFLNAHPQQFFRIGTGELSDSLALDPILEFASILIPFFANRRNAILELKTKTDFINHLTGLKHNGRTVISWSVNTPEIIATEERGTATLDERLLAAQRVATSGFPVGFHFDPIIIGRDLETEIGPYLDVVERIFAAVEPKSIAWISLGMLRFPVDLPGLARSRFPQTRIFSGEIVPTGNKMRYVRFIRERTYRPLWERLKEKLPAGRIYLCMETPSIWGRIEPEVRCNASIEKRICNIEQIPF